MSFKKTIIYKIINEIVEPFIQLIKKKLLTINVAFSFFYLRLKKKLSININPIEHLKKVLASIVSYVKFLIKKFFGGIETYFKFIITNIVNFYKILSKTIIDTLNDIYNFKVNENFIRNLFTKSLYASLFVVLIFSGFYIKGLITDVDSLKKSIEVKSYKKENIKKQEEIKIAKKLENNKKDNVKD